MTGLFSKLGRAPHLRDPGLAPASSTPWSREKTRGRTPASVTRSPVTASARPYMGDVSTILPTGLEHQAQHLGERLAGSGVASDIEDLRGAEPDDPAIASPEDGIER